MVKVPGMVPIELATVVPVPSLRPHRATRLVPEVSSEFIEPWIWAWDRALLQTRVSSMAPLKKPAAVPVEVRDVASPARWMLVDSGV